MHTMKKPNRLAKALAASTMIAILLLTNMLSLYTTADISDTWEKYRPVIGGSQIQINVKWYYKPKCTLTFPAQTTSGVKGIVTAGHCTSYQTGKSVWQPTYTSGNKIGVVASTSTKSDSAFVDLDPGVSASGEILFLNGSDTVRLKIYFYFNWYQVLEHWNSFTLYTLYKTGRTTGTTSGNLEGYYWIYYNGPGGYLYKVYRGSTYSTYGDSGAPVYFVYWDTPGGEGSAYAVGIGMISGGLQSSPIIISITSMHQYNNIYVLDYWGGTWG